MEVIIIQRCNHPRRLIVGDNPKAAQYMIDKYSNMLCERCLWACITDAPFPEVPAGVDDPGDVLGEKT